MQPIAVGGFDDKVVAALHRLRILQNGLMRISHIAAEHQRTLLSVLIQLQRDRGGAKQMPHVREACKNAVRDRHPRAVAAGLEQGDGSLGVVDVVQRLIAFAAGALGLSIAPFRLGHLNMRRVAQHDAAEAAAFLRCVDRTAIALLV